MLLRGQLEIFGENHRAGKRRSDQLAKSVDQRCSRLSVVKELPFVFGCDRPMKQIPQVIKLGPEEKAALSGRLEKNALTREDCEIIRHMPDTLEFIFEQANQKDVQIRSLPKRLLGIKSEKSKNVRDNPNSQNQSDERSPVPVDDPSETSTEAPACGDEASSNPPAEEKTKGHGRIGADAHTGADRVFIPLSSSVVMGLFHQTVLYTA